MAYATSPLRFASSPTTTLQQLYDNLVPFLQVKFLQMGMSTSSGVETWIRESVASSSLFQSGLGDDGRILEATLFVRGVARP
jgi:hypothetical protein